MQQNFPRQVAGKVTVRIENARQSGIRCPSLVQGKRDHPHSRHPSLGSLLDPGDHLLFQRHFGRLIEKIGNLLRGEP